MSIEGPIQTNTSGLLFQYDTFNSKSYVGEPTTNIWSSQLGISLNAHSGWDMPNGGTAALSSAVATAYGTWNGNRIWLITVGSGTLVSYGSCRVCVAQPLASAFATTRRLAFKIRMLSGSITNIGLHSGGGTGAHSAGDFIDIVETSVPSDSLIKAGWKQAVMDASWTSTTVTHCVGIGLNGSGPYSFLMTEPMYYPGNRLMAFTPTARSSTQGLLDLAANTTVSLANAGFNSASSITFDGTNNYIDIGTSTALNNLANTLTIEAVIKTSVPNTRQTIYGTNYANLMFGTSANTPGGLEVYTPGVYVAYTNGSLLSANAWQYVAYTRSGVGAGTHAFYVNGAAQTLASDTASNFTAVSGSKYVGLRSGIMFNGEIPVVRVYDRALSAAEIRKNYNSLKSRYGL